MNNFIADIGNAYTKAIFENTRISFPSTVCLGVNGYEYKGEKFAVGLGGQYSVEYSKADRDNDVELIIGAVDKFMKDRDRIIVDKLVIGLPVSQWIKNKERLEDKFNKLSPIVYKKDGIEKSIFFNYAEVQPECIGVYYGVEEFNPQRPTIIIDVGGLTTDIVCISPDGTITKPRTVNYGSLRLLNLIGKEIEMEYPEFGNLSITTVSDFVENNKIRFKGKEYEMEFAYKTTLPTVSELYSILTLEYAEELAYYDILMLDKVGIFYEAFSQKLPHIFYTNDSFANAEGFKALSE